MRAPRPSPPRCTSAPQARLDPLVPLSSPGRRGPAAHRPRPRAGRQRDRRGFAADKYASEADCSVGRWILALGAHARSSSQRQWSSWAAPDLAAPYGSGGTTATRALPRPTRTHSGCTGAPQQASGKRHALRGRFTRVEFPHPQLTLVAVARIIL